MQFMLKKRVRDLKNAFELTHFPKSGGKDSTENFTVSTLIYKWYWYNTYSDVVHKEFFEAIRKHMFGLFCRTVTNIWHQILSLESPPHTVINTFRFTPVWLQFLVTIWLMSDELLSSLFTNLGFIKWSCHD